MRVLVTRPLEDSARTAALLRAHGHEPMLAPLFEVRRLAAVLPDNADAVMAASANAVRQADAAGLARLSGQPFYAVGAQTADAAKGAGFSNVIAGEGDARDLAALVAAHCPAGASLLHLAGRPRRDEALAALDGAYRLNVVETYETLAMQTFPDTLLAALANSQLDAVLHFSPRAARVFGDLAVKSGCFPAAQAILHVVISEAAVDPRFPLRRVAERPSLESVIAAL
jgi:uroporphyrinogen-III synthase